MATRKYARWTQDEDEVVRKHYPHEHTKVTAERLGRTPAAVFARSTLLGVVKTPEYLASEESGRRYKGVALIPGAGFKKGHDSHNTLPVGVHRMHKGRILVKVHNGDDIRSRWQPLVDVVWLTAGNDIPEGHIVVFKEGMRTTDPDAITADMLELATRRDMMKRNTINRYPAKLHGLMIQLGNLRKRLNEETNS